MEQEMIIMIYSTPALINHNANDTAASQRQIYMHHLNLITPRHDENPLTAYAKVEYNHGGPASQLRNCGLWFGGHDS
jgi:hypothetical protein